MSYGNRNYITSVHGLRLGLQRVTTSNSGGANGELEFLVGPNDMKVNVSTADTTAATYSLAPHGISLLSPSSVGSSQVYTLDPPIPGVKKTIVGSTSATAFIKTGGVVILSTVGSTQTVISLPAAGGMINLTGVTTGLWATEKTTAGGVGLSGTT